MKQRLARSFDRRRKVIHFQFGITFLIGFVFYYLLVDQFQNTIFGARDFARSLSVGRGEIPLWGPELLYGGHLPGPALYILNVLPAHLLGTQGMTLTLIAFTALAIALLFNELSRQWSMTVAILATTSLLCSPFLLTEIFLNVNSSYVLGFTVIFFCLVCRWLEFAKGRDLLLLALLISISIQFHLSLATLWLILAAVTLQNPHCIKVMRQKKVGIISIIFTVLPLMPYLFFLLANPTSETSISFPKGESGATIHAISGFFSNVFTNPDPAKHPMDFFLRAWQRRIFEPLPHFILLAFCGFGYLSASKRQWLISSNPNQIASLKVVTLGSLLTLPLGLWLPVESRYFQIPVVFLLLGLSLVVPRIKIRFIGLDLRVIFALFSLIWLLAWLGPQNFAQISILFIFLLAGASMILLKRLLPQKDLFTVASLVVAFTWIALTQVTFYYGAIHQENSARVFPDRLQIDCSATSDFYPKVGSLDFLFGSVNSGTIRRIARTIFENTGWSAEEMRRRTYLVGLRDHLDITSIYQEQTKSGVKVSNNSGIDGYAVISLGEFCGHSGLSTKVFPRTPQEILAVFREVAPEFLAMLKKNELKVKNRTAVDGVLLLPYEFSAKTADTWPDGFGNHGATYRLPPDVHDTYLSWSVSISPDPFLKLKRPYEALLVWNPLRATSADLTIAAQISWVHHPRNALEVRVEFIGAPLSQRDQDAAPGLSLSLQDIYLEAKCKKSVNRIQLITRLGFEDNGLNFLEPLVRRFYFPCSDPRSLAIGFAGSRAWIAGKEINLSLIPNSVSVDLH